MGNKKILGLARPHRDVDNLHENNNDTVTAISKNKLQ